MRAHCDPTMWRAGLPAPSPCLAHHDIACPAACHALPARLQVDYKKKIPAGSTVVCSTEVESIEDRKVGGGLGGGARSGRGAGRGRISFWRGARGWPGGCKCVCMVPYSVREH